MGKTAGKRYRIQPSEFVDRITDDGRELTKLPYPFYVDEEGAVGRQDFWRGDPAWVIGFARDLAVQEVNLRWEEAVKTPSLAAGMYLVTANEEGDFFTHTMAVSRIDPVAASED